MATRRHKLIPCRYQASLVIRQQVTDWAPPVSKKFMAFAAHYAAGTGKPSVSDAERLAFRAIWFLYTDRLAKIKDVGGDATINGSNTEAIWKLG